MFVSVYMGMHSSSVCVCVCVLMSVRACVGGGRPDVDTWHQVSSSLSILFMF